MINEFTKEEIIAHLREWSGVDDSPGSLIWLRETVTKMNMWLERGDGIAVYENQDLGHPEIGDKRFVSFGSPDAQIEYEEAPKQLPDIGGAINWRFVLIGTYKGDTFTV